MKLIIILISIILLACSTTQHIQYNSENLAKSKDKDSFQNFYIVEADTIFIFNSNLKFSGTNFDELFAIEKVPIVYTSLALKNKIEGEVLLQVEVLADGSVGHVAVIQSLMPGPDGLDNVAIRSVKKWKFSPQKIKGEPIDCWTTIAFEFLLE